MHNVTGFICVRFNISFAVNYFRDNYIRFSGFHFIFRLNLTEQRGAKTFHSAFKILTIHRYDWISKVCSYVGGIQLKIFDASKNI